MVGTLTQADLNLVQQFMLSSVIMRKRKQENELEEMHFEQTMLINNPEMYKNYLKHKEENAENDVVWSAPATIEEAKAVEQMFAEIHSSAVASPDKAADEEFIRQINLMSPFANIEIDKIGDE